MSRGDILILLGVQDYLIMQLFSQYLRKSMDQESHLPNDHYHSSATHNHNQHHQQPPKKLKLFQRYWRIIQEKLTKDKFPKEKIKHYKQILHKSLDNAKFDRALGAIYGAMIGDAIGAYCEFHHQLDPRTVQEAMSMQGGGTFGLQPGQFTDDSELATHLIHGLRQFDPQRPLSGQQTQLVCRIGLEYVQWMDSGPFDIGNTTRCGIGAIWENSAKINEYLEGQGDPAFLQRMFDKIYQRNLHSQANGSLMRISPMAFFFSLINEEPSQHTQFIKDQIRLTHPNLRLAAAGVSWVSILKDLIERKDNDPTTFEQIFSKHRKDKQAIEQIPSWFDEATVSKEKAMPGCPNMGYVKIAFSYGLRVLKYMAQKKETRFNGQMYTDWMTWIIGRAGDTDTNGAIAGGLMGSIIGFWELPQKYVSKNLKTITDGRNLTIQTDKEKHEKYKSKSFYDSPSRPVMYEPCYALLQALDLSQKCETYKLHSLK